jgi:hypothetical protein
MLKALENEAICIPGTETTLGPDCQAAINAQSRGSTGNNAREIHRCTLRHQKEEIHRLLRNTSTSLIKVPAHAGTQHDQVDLSAKRAAGKSCAYSPPRYPALSPQHHFYLYYYDSLVQDDVRKHIRSACTLHTTTQSGRTNRAMDAYTDRRRN